MINYNDLKTNLIINNVPSDELLMKMAEQNKLEPNQIYQTPDNSSEVDFIEEGGKSVEINSTDTPVGVANFIKVNGLNYEIGGSGESSSGGLIPTGEYIDLTNEISNGSSYTAPDNGWIYIVGGNTSDGQISQYLFNQTTGFNSLITQNVTYGTTSNRLPVKKGDLIKFQWDGITRELTIRFYYANGSNSSNGSSLPIGSIFSSALPQLDAGVHLLDGSTIALDGIYKDFVNLVKTLVNAGYNLTCTQEDYENYVSLTGSCGKFVLDEENNTLRLPTITTFIQGLTDLTNIGKTVEAGLPNITASIGAAGAVSWQSAEGALYTSGSNAKYPSTGGGSLPIKLNFDASRSSDVYGKSDTVQPPSIVYPYYIVLANIGGNDSSSSNENIYSTEEIVIGKWVDGKTIYAKSYNYDESIGVNIDTIFDPQLTSNYVKHLINYYGSYRHNTNEIICIPTVFRNTPAVSTCIVINPSGLILQSGSLPMSNIILTVHYTKTSDY